MYQANKTLLFDMNDDTHEEIKKRVSNLDDLLQKLYDETFSKMELPEDEDERTLLLYNGIRTFYGKLFLSYYPMRFRKKIKGSIIGLDSYDKKHGINYMVHNVFMVENLKALYLPCENYIEDGIILTSCPTPNLDPLTTSSGNNIFDIDYIPRKWFPLELKIYKDNDPTKIMVKEKLTLKDYNEESMNISIYLSNIIESLIKEKKFVFQLKS